jgi:type II secretory pathway component PulF
MKKLSFLLQSGIPFLQALHFIKEREERKKLKRYLVGVAERIHGGQSIYKSFSVKPLLIDHRSICLIENAEMTGSIAKSCFRIAQDLELRLARRNRLISALLYPMFILVFAFILVLVLLFFVFPKILSIFDTGTTALPMPTRLLLASSHFLKENGLFIVAILSLAGGAFIFTYSRFRSFKRQCQYFFLRIPFISKLLRLVKSHLFARQISLFLEGGYTLSESLYHAEQLEKNLMYKEGFKRLCNGVKSGSRFSKLIERERRLFPKEISQFAALGEESGNLSKTLLHLSDLFEDELKEIEKRICGLLEPVLMLILGIVVGFIALSLMSPIYSLTSSLSHTSP